MILRSGCVADGEAIFRNLWSRPEAFRYLFSKPSLDLEAGMRRTEAYIQMHKEVSTEFFVCKKSTGEAIGIAGLKELSAGIWTVTDMALGPEFQGNGYGRQILTALLKLAFEGYGAEEVRYDCFSENAASKALALACGFSYSYSEEGSLRKDGNKLILDYYVRRCI